MSHCLDYFIYLKYTFNLGVFGFVGSLRFSL